MGQRPATLSAVALQVWLRRRLGFDGVIITDDLEMGGIATSLPAPQAAQEALAAGADLLLMCKDWQAARETARRLALDATLATRARKARPALFAAAGPAGESAQFRRYGHISPGRNRNRRPAPPPSLCPER